RAPLNGNPGFGAIEASSAGTVRRRKHPAANSAICVLLPLSSLTPLHEILFQHAVVPPIAAHANQRIARIARQNFQERALRQHCACVIAICNASHRHYYPVRAVGCTGTHSWPGPRPLFSRSGRMLGEMNTREVATGGTPGPARN